MQSDQNANYSGITELDESSRFLIRYNNHIANLFLLAFKSEVYKKSPVICDFGAGTGTLSLIFRSRAGEEPICVEVDAYLRKKLKSESFTVVTALTEIKSEIDFVFTSNVLEHINNDVEVLKQIQMKLSDNGILVIYVPAFQILFSELDSQVGHYRRYSRKDLRQKLRQSGLEVEKIVYVDSLGFFAALITRFLGYRGRLGLGNSQTLKIYDKFIFPLSSLLDAFGMKYLFGKNLFVLARKTNAPTL
jgi:hypothetical protein